MAAHLYWRINISANQGNTSNTTINEIEMRATYGGLDQCNGGTATASSTYGGAWATANAFDNDPATGWATAVGAATPSWIAYQFPSAVDIVQYVIRARSDTDINMMPKSWTLEWSDNGTSWTVADTQTNVSAWTLGETRVFPASPAGTGYTFWRLNISANDGGTALTIDEIEFRSSVGGADLTDTAGGVVVASVQNGSLEPATAAFDNSSSTRWSTGIGGASGWIYYQFPSAVNIKEYTLRCRNDAAPNQMPKVWTLEKSADGVNWVTADTRTGETGWTLGETRTYTVPAGHRYWRLYVSAVGSGAYVSLIELTYLGAGGTVLSGSGTATASSQYSGSYVPAYAFDSYAGSLWHSGNNAMPEWLAYDFGSITDVTAFRIQSRGGYPEQAPRDFKIQFSDDGSTWTDYFSRTGVTWTNGQTQEWNLVTSARLSQVAAEVLRLNATGDARVSQVAVEVLRLNVTFQTVTGAGGIGSAEAVGTPAVAGRWTVSPSGIPSAEAVGVPGLTALIKPSNYFLML